MDMDMDKEPVVKFPAGKQPKARCRVIFCDHCGTIMDEPANAGTNVECRMCGHTMPSSGEARGRALQPCRCLAPASRLNRAMLSRGSVRADGDPLARRGA